MSTKLYAIQQHSYTFGQTDAGCHTATSDEEIIAEATLWDNSRLWEVYEEKENFMKAVQPTLHAPAGDQWIEMPIDMTVKGFDAMVKVLKNRTPSQAYVQAGEGVRLVLSETPPVLKESGVEYDQANLAYQRELLAGKA